MRISKFVVPALLGGALMLGAAAVAEMAPESTSSPTSTKVDLVDFYKVNPGHQPGVLLTLCVVAPMNIQPQPCQILADGVGVAGFPIGPGANYVSVPDDSGTKAWTATGPGINAKSILDEGWGLH